MRRTALIPLVVLLACGDDAAAPDSAEVDASSGEEDIIVPETTDTPDEPGVFRPALGQQKQRLPDGSRGDFI